MNHSLLWEPSNACFEWCKEQNYIYESNTETNTLFILVFSLLSIIVYMLLRGREHMAPEVENFVYMLPLATFLFLVVYFIKVLWF